MSQPKYAIYVRVSTDDQTVENQILRLTEYAKSKNWPYEIFQEVKSTRVTRPVKAELLKRLRNHEYAGVIVYKLDRWARSNTELLLEITELHKKGISFISYSDNLDFTSPLGNLQFQILSAFAEFERSLISERTKEGLRRARETGKKLGRPKGAKDKKRRRKSGYLLRMAGERQNQDQNKGIFKPLDDYIQ
jgi:putative DNA-invertase from lambdoid prophage Rac